MKKIKDAELVIENSEYLKLAERRTSGFIDLWVKGENINEFGINLQTLVSSAYLQGVRDAYSVKSKQKDHK
jgi:hypothetical protein